MSIVDKYADPVAIARMSVGEVLEDMTQLGAGSIETVVQDDEGTALGGVILIAGDNAERYRAAIRWVDNLIEQEQESNEQ